MQTEEKVEEKVNEEKVNEEKVNEGKVTVHVPARKKETIAMDDGRVIEQWVKFDSISLELNKEDLKELNINEKDIVFYGVTDIPTQMGFQTIRFEIKANHWREAIIQFLPSLQKALQDMQAEQEKLKNQIVTAPSNTLDALDKNKNNIVIGK